MKIESGVSNEIIETQISCKKITLRITALCIGKPVMDSEVLVECDETLFGPVNRREEEH